MVDNNEGIFYASFSELFDNKSSKSIISQLKNDDWIKLKIGKKKNGFEYSKNGYIFYNGRKFLEQIIFKIYGNDKPIVSIPPAIYISPLSPNKRFAFITGCEVADIDKCAFKIFKLLDIQNMSISEANDSKYGTANWVLWSKSNKYAILHDASSGLLQSVNLETKKVKTLPLAERDGVGTIYNISAENQQHVLRKKDQWAEVDEKSFKWSNKEETKFIAKMDILPDGERSYWVEVDLLTGRVLEVK
ncbi:MAG: hypothetical protein KGZ42_02975 [Melioribacter sp.]|nr:hypothetical protein [Melioribacter sp.]